MKTNNEHKIFIKKSELCSDVFLMNKDVDHIPIINKKGRKKSCITYRFELCLSNNQLERIAKKTQKDSKYIHDRMYG